MKLIAEATELLRNARYKDGVAEVLTQDCEALEKAIADQQPPRVLIQVRGGCADYIADIHVNVLVIDYDNDPDAKVPDDFADLLGEMVKPCAPTSACNAHNELLAALKTTLYALYNETLGSNTPWISLVKEQAMTAIAKAEGHQ